ncbi:MAG: HPr family phosphocarrier protein [Planctomycetia bacterium]|nr:HPr family phosphocarrier protein [Planctomycetia bacterium]
MKLTQNLTVSNKAGFHLRVASMICKEAMKYEDEITLANGSYKADCKSCLDLLAIMAPCGTTLSLEVEGEHSETIASVFTEMFEKKFWEDEYSKTE